MSEFDNFTRDVLDGVKALAVGALVDQVDRIRSDALSFIEASKARLKKWGDMLENEQIDRDEFEFLVKAQGDLAKMTALTAAGISATRVKRLRDQIIAIVINSAFRAFLP